MPQMKSTRAQIPSTESITLNEQPSKVRLCQTRERSDNPVKDYTEIALKPGAFIRTGLSTILLKLWALFSTGLSIGGYIVQFVGLRGMHWSASVGQLGTVVELFAVTLSLVLVVCFY